MSALVGLAMVALAAALVRRVAGPTGVDLEALLLGATLALATLGGLGTALALADVFSAATLAPLLVVAAATLWIRRPRGEGAIVAPAWPRGAAILVAAIVVGGIALQWPPQEAELAGRDQGTYVLRARSLLARGGIDLVDPALAQAGSERARSGAMDLLGLYAIDGDPARAAVYEGAYRPGLYLASRERGEVVPQFLHMHPALLASVGLVVGVDAMTSILPLQAGLALLLLAAIARRLWADAPYAAPLAAGLLAASPLAIWVLRTPLTESLTLCLGLAAALAFLGRRPIVGAILLGSIAWVRGNAWLAAPLLLAALWLRAPGSTTRGSIAAYFGVLGASLVVHANTCFPYLHDELGRQLGAWIPVTPATLCGVGVVGAIAWAAIDRGLARRRGAIAARIQPHALRGALVAGAGLIAIYVALAARAGDGPPWSRLDPALAGIGGPLLSIAAIGLVVGLRGRLSERTDPWVVALLTLPITALALYAQRNLPQAGLFYYGRYLVPELLPAAILLAVHAIVRAPLPSRVARPLRGAAAVLLLGAVALPLVRQPVVRVAEFAGTERLIAAVAADLPNDAIVIAGGEGWHGAHTFNQVGGALVLGHGVTIVPYRSAEATHAALHELLIAGPRARGEAPPPVFLLVGEATHAITRTRGGPKVAAIDDGLVGPFRARPVGLYELYSDRLTPRVDALPDAVTRSDLRLGLFAVEVVDRGETVARFVGGAVEGAGIRLSGGTWREGQLCLDPREALVLELEPGSGPLALTLVAGPGAAATTRRWSVEADDRPLPVGAPGTPIVERDTLGPWSLPTSPTTLRIRGAGTPSGDGPCPYGALAEVHRLAVDHAWPTDAGIRARTFAPPADLGHAVRPAVWVRGRALSRMRPGVDPEPTIEGLSIRLGDGERVRFPPTLFPPGPGAWVLHLTRAEVGPGATVELLADGEALGRIAVPDQGKRSWPSPPIAATVGAAPVTIELRLVGAAGGSIAVRDVAFFSDPEIAASELVDGPTK